MYPKAISLLASISIFTGCTTLDKSFQLGGTLGAATGAAATYAAGSATGNSPTLRDVGIGAGVGFGVGLLLSYLIYDSVAKDRAEVATDTEFYFGDLPPSPFVIPQKKLKKGSFR
ncbi:MAG: hypothetical protein EOP05_00080 [Proteobacteria bacterium]|nr:MAG: hypothetical protein EOP05_00080 [Pseudomonadota bacterium]